MNSTSSRAWIVWLLASLFSMFQFFLQVASNLMTSQLMASFHLDTASMGLLSSAMFYTYVLTQVPAGLMLDRYHLRKVLLTALALCALGCVLFALSHSFLLAFISRLIIGAGAGFAFVGMIFSVSTWFSPSRIALLVGLGEFIGMLGTAIGQRYVPYAILGYGWRSVLMSCALLALVLWLCMWRWLKDKDGHHAHPTRLITQIMHNFKSAAAIPAVWLCGLYGLGLFSIVSTFVALWGASYLQAVHHHSYIEATTSISFVLLGVAIGCPVLGWLSHLHPPRTLMLLGALLALCALLTILYGPHVPLYLLRGMLFILGFAGSSALLVYSFLSLKLPPQIRGTALGLCNAIVLCSAIILQPLIGSIINAMQLLHYSTETCYETGLLTLPCVFVIAFIAISKVKSSAPV